MGIISFIIFLVIAAVVVLYLIGLYNRLIKVKNDAEKALKDIDIGLKQRHDELPKLVETCKGYMKHEQGVLTRVTELRSALLSATDTKKKSELDNQLSGALKTLFAVAENYPKLQASQNFMKLQERISGIENELADRREFYNDSVNTYNIRIHSFPDMIVANMKNYQDEEMFKATAKDKKDVKIKF